MRTMPSGRHSDAIPFPLTPACKGMPPLSHDSHDRKRERAEFSTSSTAQPDTSPTTTPWTGSRQRTCIRSEAMSYKDTAEKLADYRRQIQVLRQKMRDVQAAV